MSHICSLRNHADRVRIILDGRELIHFGSNDYLHLASDPRVIAAATDAIGRFGWGSSASPVAGGRSELHEQLENRLADWLGADAALLFSSGAAANFDVVSSFIGPNDIVCCDEQVHVSILDAARMSGAAVQLYQHGDCTQLESVLQANHGCRRQLIASESLFGSDGGLAPLDSLIELAKRHDAMLLLDEAHAIGTLGEGGAGAGAALRQAGCRVVRVGTLGKALGGMGGFVVSDCSLIEELATKARGYWHSTSLPPAACAAAIAAIDIVQAEPQRRTELQERAAVVRSELRKQGRNVRSSVSHIIPILVADMAHAEYLAAALRQAGYYLPCGIAPPNSGAGAILRLRINYGHEPWMIEGLLAGLKRLSVEEVCNQDNSKFN